MRGIMLGLLAAAAIGALSQESALAKGRNKACEEKCFKASVKPDLNPAALRPLCDACCNWDEPNVKRPEVCHPYHGAYCLLSASDCNPI
jgi:hypothetical protein